MAEEKTLDQRLMEAAAREGGKRTVYWLIGGGAVVVGPVLLIIIAAIAGLALLAGIGAWFAGLFGPAPPVIASPMSRPTEWLSIIDKDSTIDGVPNAVALAVIQQASDGEAYGDRYYCSNNKSAGENCSKAYHPGMLGIGPKGVHTLGIGYGLFGLGGASHLIPAGQDPHSVSWNVGEGLHALGLYLDEPYWSSALNQWHEDAQTPPGWHDSQNYASEIHGLVESYDAGPHLGAWAVAPWSHKTGQFEDPGNQPEWVLVVGSGPSGQTGYHAWSPPTVSQQKNPKTGKMESVVVDHNLAYQYLVGPTQVWGTLKNGKNVPFQSSAAPHSPVPVWPGGSEWGAKVPLAGKDTLKTITARWADGNAETIPWPETSGNDSGITWYTKVANAETVDQIWNTYKVPFTAAAQQAHIPVAPLVSEAYWESRGIAYKYEGSGYACGVFQMFSPGSFTAYQPNEPPGACANPAIEAVSVADYLSYLYGLFGSWRAAIAGYYGGQGTVLNAGVHRGMTWAQDAPLLNFVPDPSAGNVETMSQYAENSFNTVLAFAKAHGMPAML